MPPVKSSNQPSPSNNNLNMPKPSANKSIDNKPPEKKKEKSKPATVIFLGFDKYQKDDKKKKIFFNTYFVPVKERIAAGILKLSLKIKYKNSLRALNDKEEKVEIECRKRHKKRELQVRFKCELNTNDKDIENIEVENNFNFVDQEVTIKATSPLAKKYMTKLQTLGREEKFNKKLYILENTELNQDSKSFYLLGRIRDKQFDNDNVVLTVSISEGKAEEDVECSIEKKKGKHRLICNPKKDIESNLDGVFGDLGDENLVINFKDNADSDLTFHVEKKEKKKEKHKKKEEDDDDSNKEENKENKKNENEEKPHVSAQKVKKEAKENDEDLNENDFTKFFTTNVIIYIAIGFAVLVILILLFIFISKAKKGGLTNEQKANLDNSSMDIIKYGSKGSSSD